MTGFDSDAVISHINGAVHNPQIAGGVRIDAIRIRRVRRILDRDAANEHIIAVERMYSPERRASDRNIFQTDMLTVLEVEHRRTPMC